MPLQLSRLTFRAGRQAGDEPTQIDPLGPILVLVGPNNSGKSAALREIREWTTGSDNVRRVVDQISIEMPDSALAALQMIEPFRQENPPPGHPRQEGMNYYSFPSLQEEGIDVGARLLRPADVPAQLAQPQSPAIRSSFVQPLTMRLDGPTRFQLSADQPLGDLQEAPTNHLAALFRDDAARGDLQEMVARAFDRYPVLEAAGNGSLRLRLSSRALEDYEEERGLTSRAVEFHAQAELLVSQGDGIRAFVGLLAAVMSLPHRILLVDEPEAFLHPPLARRLGRYLASLVPGRGGTLIAATHSGDFLAGCVDSGQDISVVRLTYEGEGTATARVLGAGDLKTLMTEPLVRSARVLSGLFHRGVVVVEGDSDRVFYDEINERLDDAERGVTDALFINAHNWQTVGRIIEPLRRLGVPAAGIIDLDAIVKGGEWSALWRALNLRESDRNALGAQRAKCEALLRATEHDGDKPYKREGLHALPPDDRSTLADFIEELALRGLFVVPVGSLESWLPELGVDGKSSWIERIFDVMGGDPADEHYVSAGEGGPWEFLSRVENWVADAARAGMG